MLRSTLGLAVGLLALAGAASCADLGIMPVAVQLDRSHDRATIQVHNRGDEPVTMQADAGSWTRRAGRDHDAPTDDLIVNPPVFTIPPGRTQIVRLGLRRGIEAEQETMYRMVLREVPPVRADERLTFTGSVRVLVTMRVPVYVAPRVVQRNESWSIERDAQGQLLAAVTNAGNVHMKVASLRLFGDSTKPLAEQASGQVLFPGESRSFLLPNAGPLPAQALTLEVQSDRGVERVGLAQAPR